MTSFFEASLKTEEAKKAYGAGLVKLFETKNLDNGIDTMFGEAEKNGALKTARFSLGLDILKALVNEFKK